MFKTTGKEYFYMVSGIMAPKYMVSDTLTEDIEFFVDWVAKNAKELEYLVERNMKTFVAKMEDLYKLLCAIYAHWLEMEAARILRMRDIKETDICKKLVTPFVANLHTLAIDIQMAQNQGFETSYRQRDEIERYRGIISSMKIISTLLESSEFEKAFDLSLSIDELQGSEYAVPFMSGITSKNPVQTSRVIEKIIAAYSKKIDDIISAATETIVLKKILIVDDMPETLGALSYMLRGHYQVFAFLNCNEALNFIDNKQQPDAFILDIEMPEMDGFTLAKKIRERTNCMYTPILFLTGNSTRETLMKSVLYGAKAFLVKPASKDIIISKLSSCL